MEENGFDAAYETLDQINEILNELLWMSARAADPDCGDGERKLLQRDFAALQEKLDRLANRYTAAVTEISARLAKAEAVMETEQVPGPEGEMNA